MVHLLRGCFQFTNIRIYSLQEKTVDIIEWIIEILDTNSEASLEKVVKNGGENIVKILGNVMIIASKGAMSSSRAQAILFSPLVEVPANHGKKQV